MKRVTKYYGLRSLLAVVSLPLAWISASRGGNGWQARSAHEAELDAEAMIRTHPGARCEAVPGPDSLPSTRAAE